MANQRMLSLLALFASFFAFGVIGLGAFTRLVNAGLGCPDWPGCYGQLIVPLTDSAKLLANTHFPETPVEIYKAWAEMIHRYFVGGLSVVLLIIVGLIFFKKACRTRGNIFLSIGLVLLLLYQIMLGRATVTLKLLPIVVTQHLLGGFLILAFVWLIYLINKPIHSSNPINPSYFKKWLPWGLMGLIILFAQIALGAWTSTNYASLSCTGFPFCLNGQTTTMNFKDAFTLWGPIGINYEGGILSDSARQTIQMTHRIGALILTLYFFTFIGLAFLRLKHSLELSKSLYLMLGLLIIQLCLGISNVIFNLPLFNALSHNLVAVLLLLSLITFIFNLFIETRQVQA